MLEQELKDIWNNSSRTAQISIETSLLIEESNAKVNSIQKIIRRRDISEISASIIGIIIYSYLLYEIPFPISKLASVLSIIWFVYVIFKFNKSKYQNKENDLSLSITGQINSQEKAMKQQERLLNSAAYWYSMLPFIINFIFILGLGNPSDYSWTNSIAERVLPLGLEMKIMMLTGLVVFYALIIWINKRAVKRDIKPIIAGLTLLKSQMGIEEEGQ